VSICAMASAEFGPARDTHSESSSTTRSNAQRLPPPGVAASIQRCGKSPRAIGGASLRGR
jgi:hypothetical protein